ncbi:MAG TPA: hypothetical protein VGX23_23420 [Actinocrinis sp.]|nr:hypothetical protein [Actinocrinis sp.]
MSTQSDYGQPTYTRPGVDDEAREALNTLHAELTRIADDLSGEQLERTRQFTRLRSALADADQAAADQARAARRLAARVDWLERRLRATGTIPVADLGGAGPEALGLAAAVVLGRDAEESLLDPAGRASLKTTAEAFARLEDERDQAAEDVLKISAALESTARTDLTHAQQLARFDAAEQRLAFAATAVAENLRFARAARERLNEDDRSREELAPVIEAGLEARATLEASLRTRLATEVARGALLPAWFSADLGPEPVDQDSAADWLTAAADASTHRLVYGIDDTRSVLGPRPAPTEPKHRRTEYARLAAELNRLDA